MNFGVCHMKKREIIHIEKREIIHIEGIFTHPIKDLKSY